MKSIQDTADPRVLYELQNKGNRLSDYYNHIACHASLRNPHDRRISFPIERPHEISISDKDVLIVTNCHERIRAIAPVIDVNSIKEPSEVTKQLYIHSCSTGA